MSLSDTRIKLKKIILISVVVTIIYYIGVFALRSGKAIWDKIFPPKDSPIEAKWGKLPALQMISKEIKGTPEYILETTSGSLPTLPDRALVYKFKPPEKNLLAEQQMKNIAETLGFKEAQVKSDLANFNWVDGNNKRTMSANVVTKDINLKTDPNRLSSELSKSPTINETDAKNAVNNFLKSKLLLNQDELSSVEYTTIPSVVAFGKYKDNKLFPNTSKIIKVNVNRRIIIPKTKPTDKDKIYKILGNNPLNPNISIFVTNSSTVYKMPDINYNYHEILTDTSNKSEYPLASVNTVWSEVISQGKGVVAYAQLDSDDYYSTSTDYEIEKISIQDIYLAYYEPREVTSYMQPIYVFEGKFSARKNTGGLGQSGTIYIYYPALSGDFVGL
jgi:hypothetical protein